MEAFWKNKALDELDEQEWEALCDRCALCCLQKLECDETGEVFYTRLACHLLDLKRCVCSDYEQRTSKVPDCMELRTFTGQDWQFMPSTCAYRLRYEGKPLPDWHPLVAGSDKMMHELEIGLHNKSLIHDKDVAEEDYEEHIIHWVSI